MRLLIVIFLAMLGATAHAQNALVVQTCGTLPAGASYTVGQTVLLTIDVNGNLCTPHTVQMSGGLGQQVLGIATNPEVVTTNGSFVVSCPANPISKKVPPFC